MTITIPPTDAVPVRIRWMIRRDMPEVLDIEAESFEFPWSEQDFIRCLRLRYCIGMVAVAGDSRAGTETVVGYMIYELLTRQILLLNCAVTPDYRRRGVGSQLIAKLISKLSPQRRRSIAVKIRETNLSGQLFW